MGLVRRPIYSTFVSFLESNLIYYQNALLKNQKLPVLRQSLALFDINQQFLILLTNIVWFCLCCVISDDCIIQHVLIILTLKNFLNRNCRNGAFNTYLILNCKYILAQRSNNCMTRVFTSQKPQLCLFIVFGECAGHHCRNSLSCYLIKTFINFSHS